jgi:hypothetical protein
LSKSGSKGSRSVKDWTIFDDPATVQKVDRITVELPHDIPGVNPERVLSITHPKLKTTMTASSGIKRVFARSVTTSPRRKSRRSASNPTDHGPLRIVPGFDAFSLVVIQTRGLEATLAG